MDDATELWERVREALREPYEVRGDGSIDRATAIEARVALDSLRTRMKELENRIEELNRMKARTWTTYEMSEGVWTFSFHIDRDDGEDVLAHELAHAVQRFRHGVEDEVHSQRHEALVSDLTAALSGKLAKAEQERDELRANFTRWSQEKADELEAFRAKLEQTEQERDEWRLAARGQSDHAARLEQERDKARELVKHYITKHDAVVDEFQALRAKLAKAEAVIEAARAENDRVLGLSAKQYAWLRAEADRLRIALSSYDQEENA